MAAQESKATTVNICDKCGSEMIQRVISLRDGDTVRHKKILQCKICRHWISI
ncbi:MAG: hypothetical protein P8Y70_20315 [Candidatus Lokiarchaeota archaeon]